MPNTTIIGEGEQALCAESQMLVSSKSQPSLWKSFSAFSGGATPTKSSRLLVQRAPQEL